MNQDIILANEMQNIQKYIYVYVSDVENQWTSYGLSAYALRLYVKSKGYDSLRLYSADKKMPCTIVCTETINFLRQELKIVEEIGEKIVFERPNKVKFKNEEYLMWKEKICKEGDSQTIRVKTMVSDLVPKYTFIKDGMSSFSRNMKRVFDFFVALITLIIFSPLMLICYIAIKLDDGGPAIYAQERVGRFGRTFKIYKFRSMRQDAEKMGPQLSAQQGEGDVRLTKVGRFLRAHHLDELPQLWNVFCGDMAFIGPRPERQFFIDQIMEYDNRYTYLYQIRPGVTSYATLYNGYTDTIEKMLKRLEYDLYYLQHRSWWFDIKILWCTFWKIVTGKNF